MKSIVIKFSVAAILLLSIAQTAASQAPVSTYQPPYTAVEPINKPGSAWGYVGNTSPIDRGDIFSNNHFEQGFGFLQRKNLLVEGFGSLDANFDSQGQIWANSYIGQFGVKANFLIRHGVVTVTASRAYENQWLNGIKAWQNEISVNTWIGWQEYTSRKFPGEAWAIVGDTSPAEKGNMLFMMFAQQGYVAHRFSAKTVFVPIIEETIGTDSQRFDWNNFTRTGFGAMLRLPHSFEVSGLYNYEIRPITGQRAGGFSVNVKVWLGWELGAKVRDRFAPSGQRSRLLLQNSLIR
jgi:hypothetical protein